ncbi:hypothetical protein SKAU_G00074820 [Synaphobranchus kaupii]|uniref:Uncharacterized protein n=1 Tax=Synaphobranchus kaupii TaxID=118154 RepID=A0A9Q1G8J6_SYNKA|nr:hypothetical protein SKAU_G00074820 [Synaphobranchus kaupii]
MPLSEEDKSERFLRPPDVSAEAFVLLSTLPGSPSSSEGEAIAVTLWSSDVLPCGSLTQLPAAGRGPDSSWGRSAACLTAATRWSLRPHEGERPWLPGQAAEHQNH